MGQMAYGVAVSLGATETAARATRASERAATSLQLQLGRLEEAGKLTC